MAQRYVAYLPNTLTSLRILLAGMFPITPMAWRIGVVSLALLTEYFDGAVSRWFNVASKTGQILDPIADKLFFISVAGTFLHEGKLTLTTLLLIGLRDIAVIIGVIWILLRGHKHKLLELEPSAFGKIATAMQYAVFFDLLIEPYFNIYLFFITVFISSLAAITYIVNGAFTSSSKEY